MYTIQYDARVARDVASLSNTTHRQIRTAIEVKLTTSPEIFGKPLRHSLLGFRSLRVGDYRVVFRIEKNTVTVLFIGHRSVGYKRVEQRVT